MMILLTFGWISISNFLESFLVPQALTELPKMGERGMPPSLFQVPAPTSPTLFHGRYSCRPAPLTAEKSTEAFREQKLEMVLFPNLLLQLGIFVQRLCSKPWTYKSKVFLLFFLCFILYPIV